MLSKGTASHAQLGYVPSKERMPRNPRHPSFLPTSPFLDNFRLAASLDRKRFGAKTDAKYLKSIRGVFDKEVRRKPLAFAADAVSYGN
jgi:hypothetical protein